MKYIERWINGEPYMLDENVDSYISELEQLLWNIKDLTHDEYMERLEELFGE